MFTYTHQKRINAATEAAGTTSRLVFGTASGHSDKS